jgi:hypothetical protein
MSDPKQHHYIPTTYLEHFCDEAGVLWAHDKWTGESFPSKPASILKEKRYYAQPDHENRTWNNVIENFFSDQIETPWPKTVRLIQSGPRQLSQLYNLYMFLYSLRVRVPNCRKAVEYSLQERVRLAARTIEDEEFLGRERKMVEHFNKALNRNYTCIDELYDDGVVVITIDPHKSLEAMADLAKGFSRVVFQLQFNFITNRTSVDFNCSDNPIVYFPAGQSSDHCDPYRFRSGEPFEFIFPISKRHCLYHNSFSPVAAQQIVTTETANVDFVRRIDNFVGAFADRYVISSRKLETSEAPTRNRCPRPVAYTLPMPLGTALYLQYEMGEPLRLPKWDHAFEEIFDESLVQ